MALLEQLRDRGVALWLDGEQVRFRGPAGALSPALMADLRSAKSDIAALLRAEEESPFPLTKGQRALWFLHRSDPESPAYHIRFTVELRADADASRIRAAMQILAQRHAMLRSRFAMEDGQPVQFIRSHMEWELNERRLAPGALPNGEADEPFDLESGPVCRVTLFHRDGLAPILQFSAHH
ncbi:MAG TPA: condensation domain-containing protein, partial [Candidatus Saccharimonadales bacterium]|nr:condensation domain-containing protein [Candidatus Saccharimonadales bacterium]